METVLRYIIIAAIGALASVLANTGIAVFNDGLRPVVPEYLEGRMDRKALAATSFAIGFGLVIGYGLPTSIAASIILIHCILLTTDIIGTFCPDGRKGMIMSAVIGAVYGVALLFGLQVIIDLFNMLPVNFLGALGQVSTGITLAFAIFPAVTVALQFGVPKGIFTAGVTLLVRQIVEVYGKIAIDAEHTISLNKDGMALLAGMVIMLIFAARDKEGAGQNSNEMLTQVFADKVLRIRKYMPVLAVMGGLLAAGTSMAIIAGDPISLGLLAEGDRANAAITALARAIGFVPLVATTAITTGVYAPAGMTFVFVIGLFITNPLIAFVLGAACICVEILLLNVIAKGLDAFPGIKRCGDNIRTAMSYVIDIALLIGGILAAQAIMPTTGLFIVVAFWCINKCSKKPLVSMAVGPLGAILVGLIANVLYLLTLYVPAA
ncbi:MAG: YhfT family protein [Gemmiger sp.]